MRSRVHFTRSERASDCRGTAYIEFLICIPLFITLFLGLMESARWFEAQMMVSRVAYEAARYAASLEDLTPTNGQIVTALANGDKTGTFQAELKGDQIAILRRIRANLAVMEGGSVNPDLLARSATVNILFRKTGGAITESEKPIRIRVSMPYVPMFKIFPVDHVAATGEANYLWKTLN